jgi:hypothetical protein
MSLGWPLDSDGNVRARWMVTALLQGTELGLQACLPHVLQPAPAVGLQAAASAPHDDGAIADYLREVTGRLSARAVF